MISIMTMIQETKLQCYLVAPTWMLHLGWLVSGFYCWLVSGFYWRFVSGAFYIVSGVSSNIWTFPSMNGNQSSNQSTNWLIDWLVTEFCHHQESQERFSDNPGPGLLWGVLPLPACHWLSLEKVGPNMITTMPIVVWWRYQWWKPWWEVPSNSSLLCLSPQILIHYDVLQIGIRFSPPTLRWRFKRALLILRYVWKHQDRIFIKWSTLHKVDVLLGSNTQEGLLFTQVIFQQLTIR